MQQQGEEWDRVDKDTAADERETVTDDTSVRSADAAAVVVGQKIAV